MVPMTTMIPQATVMKFGPPDEEGGEGVAHGLGVEVVDVDVVKVLSIVVVVVVVVVVFCGKMGVSLNSTLRAGGFPVMAEFMAALSIKNMIPAQASLWRVLSEDQESEQPLHTMT